MALNPDKIMYMNCLLSAPFRHAARLVGLWSLAIAVAGMLPARSVADDAAGEKLLREIRAAMAERDLPGGKSKLQEAAVRDGSPEFRAEVERLQLLYDYLFDFWRAVDEGGAALRAGEELVFGDARVAVVEYDAGRIVVRALGQNRRYTLRTMPTKLVLKLASRSLKADSAANKVFLGTYHAMDAKGDRDEARRLWDEARRGGADVTLLLPELATPAAETAAVPSNRVEPPPLSAAAKGALEKTNWIVRRRTPTHWESGPLDEWGRNTADGRLEIKVPAGVRGDVQILFHRKLAANFGCRLTLTDLPPGQVAGLFPTGFEDGGHVVLLPAGTAPVAFARQDGKYRARVNDEELPVISAPGTPPTLAGHVGFTLSPGGSVTLAAMELLEN